MIDGKPARSRWFADRFSLMPGFPGANPPAKIRQ